MKKNKPETIADLDIVWTFTNQYLEISKFCNLWEKLNTALVGLKIKPKEYKFNYRNESFIINWDQRVELLGDRYIVTFLEIINYKMYARLKSSSEKLIQFVKINDSTFEIITETIHDQTLDQT